MVQESTPTHQDGRSFKTTPIITVITSPTAWLYFRFSRNRAAFPFRSRR